MTTEQAPREPAAEALELASVLRCMTECGNAPDDLWTRDQPDGDPFVARAAELLEHFARALVASQAQPTRCVFCDDSGDVHSLDGAWRGRCICKFGQAQPAEPRQDSVHAVESGGTTLPLGPDASRGGK